MSFNFEALKKKVNEIAAQATEMGRAGAVRSRQLANAAKLKANNLGEEDTIRKAYIEMGKLYFEKYGQNPEDDFAAACSTIIEAQAAIAANNALIEELVSKDEPDVEVEIVEEAAEEVKSAVEEAVDAVEDAVDAAAEEAAPVLQAVEEVVDAVKEAVAEEAVPVVEAVEEVVEEVAEKIADAQEEKTEE